MKRGAITLGVDGDRRNAHFATRTGNPNGDFAAVGDEDFHEAPQRQAGVDRAERTGLGI
jgi:hypothetical protein